MLACHEKNVAEALRREVACFGGDLFDFESHALDGILARESAVGAGVDALVGEVERREESHRAAEMPARHCRRACGEGFQRGVAHGREQRLECAQGG